MNKSIVKVSIIVPVYNLAHEVTHALDSILAQQDAPDFEVLVIDDHSTDNSFSVVSEYAKKDSRIKVMTNTRGKGVAGARNTGFENAQGQWITFLDSDDSWEVNNLSTFIKAIAKNPSTDIFTADRYETIKPGQVERLTDFEPIWQKYFSAANASGEYLRVDNPAQVFFDEGVLMRTGSGLIRKSLIEKVGYCDETLKAAVDMSWFFKLATQVDHIVYVPTPVMNYQHRSDSLTRNIPFGIYGVGAYKKMLTQDEFKAFTPQIKKQVALWSLDSCYYYRKNKDKLKAIKAGFDAVYYDPSNSEYWKNFFAALLLR